MSHKRYFPVIAILVLAGMSLACNGVTSLLATPTPTPTMTPTMTPTVTPTLTPTIEPTMTPIAGWEKFEGNGMELWLPESFDGGKLPDDLDLIVEKLRKLGPEFKKLADTIEQNPSAFALLAFDTHGGAGGSLTNVTVIKEKVISVMTVEVYMDAITQQMPPGFKVIDQNIVSLDRYEAGRLVLQATIASVKMKEVVYAIKDKNVMWSITYAVAASGFDKSLPDFEQSINTFQVLP